MLMKYYGHSSKVVELVEKLILATRRDPLSLRLPKIECLLQISEPSIEKDR